MKIKELYQEIVKKGIAADIRGKKAIDEILKARKEEYDKLSDKKKRFFDLDNLVNPFADTRILNGNPQSEIKSIIVGVDVEGPELLLVDRLRDKGIKIDLAISHHPEGRAFAHFYEVMDVQVDIFNRAGISLGVSEKLLSERKAQVERKIGAANHSRGVDIARLLDINFLCAHTPCDNLAYQTLKKIVDNKNPKKLGTIMDILYDVPEYAEAASGNNPPKIIVGSRTSRVKNVHFEFTGGTEGPKDIYDKLSSCGVDTIIAMHQSEEHFQKCRKNNINVIIASHIASDNLGINLMLDYLETKAKFKIHEFSGFRRFKRKQK